MKLPRVSFRADIPIDGRTRQGTVGVMRRDRCVLAITTTSSRYGQSPSFSRAFIQLPLLSPSLAPADAAGRRKSATRYLTTERTIDAPNMFAPRSVSAPGGSTGRDRCSLMNAVEGQGGEMWCGHELFNTVTTDWVQDHLFDPELALVDIRGRVNKEREGGSDFFRTTYEGLKYDYLDAHIPGAVFVDWTKDIACADENGVAAQLIDRENFVIAMQERGVGGSKRVVVYDNGDMLFATRFWWAMRRFGHDRVSVMDGGWAKWLAENKEVTPDCPCPLKIYTEWELEEDVEWLELRASKADVITALEENGSVQALDARAKTQFTGEVRRARRGGRIPGAKNTPYKDFLTVQTGPKGDYRVFKGLDGIREVFESAGVDTSASAPPVIAYCNGGVASTVALFGLFQLGLRDHAGGCPWSNYDGGWNEWGNDEMTPVEQ